MLDYICKRTNEYIDDMPKLLRKKYGQFFTSKETAMFMASLFDIPKHQKDISILDPGAGTGILAVAIVERLQKYDFEHIYLTCYENDENVIDILKENLSWVLEKSNIPIEFKIISDNYITSQALDFNDMIGTNINPCKYDLIIGNPPYMKLPKDAPEAISMPIVCYGAPNMYSLFASMSLFNLNDDGEMVYIMPRSWTSGAYFKRFRDYLFKYGVLEHIHLFVSRDEVFEQEKVLQETMIIKVRKSRNKPQSIVITTTHSNNDFSSLTKINVEYDNIVFGDELYVYLITDEYELEVLRTLHKWNNTLPSLGLKMKTGLTVDFRNKNLLRNKMEQMTVPLFYSQHIQGGKVAFPIGKENEYIITQKDGLLQPNTNYLFVKRFTSKEEKRRLQCGIYLAKRYSNYSMISTQNKVNFITGLKELSDCVVFGLYVIFNSTLYDKYYRILNGSTQVNSTEVNSMPMPPLNMIESMGKSLIKHHDLSESVCDEILRCYI